LLLRSTAADVFTRMDLMMKYETPVMIVVSKPVVNTYPAGSGKI